MDFDLTPHQRSQLTALDEIVDTEHPPVLDAKLAASGLATGTLLERVLIAERLAERGVASTFGLRAVLTADDLDLPDGPLAIMDVRRAGPVRYGNVASAVIVLDDDEARLREAADLRAEPVPSGFGFEYATVTPGPGRALDVPVDVLRRRWRLVLSAEIAGTAAAGIAHTAAHLRTREQFGQSLSTFQALRHRLADAAVSAEAVRWLTREAAWSGDERAALLAASYATSTAAALATELTQLCGARAFTHEFGLHVYTMRLEGLRLELGAPDRIAVELAATRAS